MSPNAGHTPDCPMRPMRPMQLTPQRPIAADVDANDTSLSDTMAIINTMDVNIARLSTARPVRFVPLVDGEPFVSVRRAPGGGPWCLWNERGNVPLRDSPVADRLEFLKTSGRFFREYLAKRNAFPREVEAAQTEGQAALDLLRGAKP